MAGDIQASISLDVSGVEQGIQSVNKSLSNLKPVTQQAANSLNALSQVARDAPFGFIAIQNNLPILFDQFGALTKASGGVVGAFKNLGSALVGPAGITFAIGAAISGATALIQKYGSIGEGIKVLLGISKELTESQKAYNKAIAETSGSLTTENYKVEILTKTLINNKAPQKDRLAAYNELKKIGPDVIAGIDKENALTSESSLLIQSNAEARKELIRLKITEAGISASLTQNESKLAELRNKLTIADQEYVKSAEELNKVNKNAIITGLGSRTQQQNALESFNNNAKAVQELRGQIDNLNKEQDNYLKQLDPISLGIAKINSDTNNRIELLKKQQEEQNRLNNQKFDFSLEKNVDLLSLNERINLLEKLGTTILNTKNKEKERTDALRQLAELEPEVWGNLKLTDLSYKQLQATLTGVGKTYQQLILQERERVSALSNVEERIKNQTYQNKLFNDELRKEINARTELKALELAPKQLPTTANVPINGEEIKRQAQIAKGAFDEIKKEANFTSATTLMQNTFFNPLTDLFDNFIQTGRFAFKEFANAILKAISQIVAKIIATGIIVLLASILFPGAGGIGATFGANIGSAISSAIGIGGGFGGGNRVAAPTFNGVRGGSMQMAGAVNLQLRGSDLVGAINRTNATINRVG